MRFKSLEVKHHLYSCARRCREAVFLRKKTVIRIRITAFTLLVNMAEAVWGQVLAQNLSRYTHLRTGIILS